MNPKQLRIYRQSMEQLRSGSEELFLRMLNELCKTYSSYEFVRTLHGHLRGQRYDLALRYADSLSAQKYADATIHFVANQFSQLLRKYPWDSKSVKTDPEAQAIATFLKSERKCARLNKKFRLYGNYRSPHELLLDRMRNFIRYTIGMEPNIQEVLDNCEFGSGASIGVHGSATSLARKVYAKEWSVSFGASDLAFVAILRNAQLRDVILPARNNVACYDIEAAKAAYVSKRQLTEYNKISFVPKTAKTHRAIAVEPLLNGFVQKGIDLVMRKRLKRIGIDLSDQSKNQELARQGSLDDSDNGFVTIDLSAASDSISIGLVRYLLPERWFDLLDRTRSKNFKLNGRLHTYHKFCSMGNGFCFPLETLIFVACCNAIGCGVPGTDFSVYGDDIIVRKKYALDVLNLLRVIGFKPNSEKTFLQGPFRESCGADWFGGVDVRPYTLDYRLDSIPNLYKWLNLTRRSPFTEDFFSDFRSYIFALIPPQFQFVRPYKGNADTGIDSLAEEYLTCRHCNFSRRKQRWVWKELSHQPVPDKGAGRDGYRRDSVDMYALLRGSLSRNYSVEYTFRRKTRTTVRITSHSGSTQTFVSVHQSLFLKVVTGRRCIDALHAPLG